MRFHPSALWRSHASVGHYQHRDDSGLADYSKKALARVSKARRFSWWMTMLLHRFPSNVPYADKLQETELAYSLSSEGTRVLDGESRGIAVLI
jgi:p-hydroxybenzoate 3-monooxygenase